MVAFAHTELVTSSPAPGAGVSLASDRVQLVFGTEIASVGNDVMVRDPDGHDVTRVIHSRFETPSRSRWTSSNPGRTPSPTDSSGRTVTPPPGAYGSPPSRPEPPLSATAVQLGGHMRCTGAGGDQLQSTVLVALN